jgi:hypothetical protein
MPQSWPDERLQVGNDVHKGRHDAEGDDNSGQQPRREVERSSVIAGSSMSVTKRSNPSRFFLPPIIDQELRWTAA